MQARLNYSNSAREMPEGDLNEITFAVTPHGILANIPIVACGDAIFGDLYWRDGRFCGLLCLEEDPDSRAASSRRPSYRVCSPRILQTSRPTEGGEYIISGHTGRASWGEVLIRPAPSPHDSRLPGQLSDSRLTFIPAMPRQLALDAPYRFDEASIRRFLRESRADRLEVRNAELPSRTSRRLMRPSTGSRACLLIVIKVGQCYRLDGLRDDHPHPAHVWAMVSAISPALWPPEEKLMEFSNDLHMTVLRITSRWPALQKRFDLDADIGGDRADPTLRSHRKAWTVTTASLFTVTSYYGLCSRDGALQINTTLTFSDASPCPPSTV